MIITAPQVPQLILPGQAAAPAGPVDVANMYVMHRAFRRDLDLFHGIVPKVETADRARWARLQTRFAFFSMVLHKHHHGEDIGLWPMLAERGADATVLARLEADHADVDVLVTAVADDLRRLAGGAGGEVAKARLTGSVGRLHDVLAAHLALEEREGMAELQRCMSPADWERLEEEVFAADYRPRDIPAVLGWVTAGLTGQQLGRVRGCEGPAMRTLARIMSRRFERREARTFGARS